MYKLCILLLLLTAGSISTRAQTSATTTPPSPGCHAEPLAAKDRAPAQSILEGYGTGGFTIKTENPQAQAYFNNGMQLAHAFAHRSAVAAFRRAEELDPSCAMCVWGEAWTRGPSINYTIGDDVQAELGKLADHAAVLAKENPEREKALIAALQKRYKNGGGKGKGDQDYARAMDAVAATYPTDNEIANLTADAWMIPASQANTRDHLDHAIQILEAALKRDPNDTGLIHFYTHATEMDGVAAEALPYAEKLPVLAPAASHLIHMPSHTYFRVGRYRDAEQSNLNAVAVDNANADRLKPKGGVFTLNYHGHNVVFGEAATLIDGDVQAGLSLAATEVQQLPTFKPEQPFQQFNLVTAYVVYGRYGSKTAVDSLIDPGSAMPFAEALWHYARGEAAARRQDVNALREETAAIHITEGQAKKFGDSSSQVTTIVDIARCVLLGRLAMLEKRWSDAEVAFRNAADLQEMKLDTIPDLTDPPAWWYPVRRSVAAALLAKGDLAAATAEIEQVLVHWPGDPVSLKILADCETQLGRGDEAKGHLRLAQTNWTGDINDVPLWLL
jgi:tetratricopeptide (TPR) repeat protein